MQNCVLNIWIKIFWNKSQLIYIVLAESRYLSCIYSNWEKIILLIKRSWAMVIFSFYRMLCWCTNHASWSLVIQKSLLVLLHKSIKPYMRIEERDYWPMLESKACCCFSIFHVEFFLGRRYQARCLAESLARHPAFSWISGWITSWKSSPKLGWISSYTGYPANMVILLR